MVSLTDGMYLSHGLTEMLALEFLKGAGCSVLVRGHGGELAKSSLAWPLHTDAAIRAFDSTQQLVPYLWRRANYISPALKTTKVFTDRWAQLLDGGARTSLEEAVAQVPLAPPDLCSYLYLTEHHRRSTVPSLELFRQAVEVRTPFVDPRFLATLFRAPSAWRDGTQIHRALMSTGSRRLMEVRNSNTGAPVDAGPAAEFALDKLNSLLRRLNVRGYRHYHNFHGWMRDQLLAAVEAVLLSSESLDRGIVRPEGVQELIERTRSGLVDHGYLLQVLLIIELWQRENL